MSNSPIWPIDRTLSGAITLGQSGSESNSNEGVLCIPQSSGITGASPLDCLASYPGYLLGEGRGLTLSAEMQSVYSTALANWANQQVVLRFNVTYISHFWEKSVAEDISFPTIRNLMVSAINLSFLADPSPHHILIPSCFFFF